MTKIVPSHSNALPERGLKLFIQIPCLNEAAFLREVIESLPKDVPGFASVSIVVIDDGSIDETAQLAESAGADYVLKNGTNLGLARTYIKGLEECLKRGADVIVNYDADGQYCADHIPRLTRPILENQADLVVGTRPIEDIKHFSGSKKFLQKFGSRLVRLCSGVNVEDAPSGFRAVTRKTAAQLYVFNTYTYTLETLIQAGQTGMRVATVPISVNPVRRPSRLMKSSSSYVMRSAKTILRFSFLYQPFKAMLIMAVLIGLPGLISIFRFLIAYASGQGGGMVQSLVLGSTLVLIAIMLCVGGLLAELIAANRRLLQEIRARQILEATDGRQKKADSRC